MKKTEFIEKRYFKENKTLTEIAEDNTITEIAAKVMFDFNCLFIFFSPMPLRFSLLYFSHFTESNKSPHTHQIYRRIPKDFHRYSSEAVKISAH